MISQNHMAKQVIFDAEVRSALKRGVDVVANAVKVTLGPKGRNVALDKSWGGPTITNDGVSIAKDITLADKFEDMGASIVKEVVPYDVFAILLYSERTHALTIRHAIGHRENTQPGCVEDRSAHHDRPEAEADGQGAGDRLQEAPG